jgi:hypothetical protein
MPNMRELIPEASNTLKQAVQEQNTIGWEHWFKGRLSMLWGTLYNHDIKTKNHGIRNQTAEKWGKHIVNMNWDFMLEAWTIRIELEHCSEGDPTIKQKERLISKILWTKRKIDQFPSSYLRNITEEQLQDIPLGNLKMVDSQIQTLLRAARKQPTEQNNN